MYARTKSPQKSIFLFPQGMEHGQCLCPCYQNPGDGSKFNQREVQKHAHIKSKGQCKKNSYIFMHNNDCKTPYNEIYIELLLINFNLLSVL